MRFTLIAILLTTLFSTSANAVEKIWKLPSEWKGLFVNADIKFGGSDGWCEEHRKLTNHRFKCDIKVAVTGKGFLRTTEIWGRVGSVKIVNGKIDSIAVQVEKAVPAVIRRGHCFKWYYVKPYEI